MATDTRYLDDLFSTTLIYKDSVNFFMLGTSLLMQGQIFADFHGHCAMREGGENRHFWCKKDIGRKALS